MSAGMFSTSDRAALERRLASLLGFDDVSDVFDHLLSIESSEDLLDYLSQLLGGGGEEVRQFVGDVGRFKGGEDLVYGTGDGGAPANDAPALQNADVARGDDEDDDRSRRRTKSKVVRAAEGNSAKNRGGEKERQRKEEEERGRKKEEEERLRREAEDREMANRLQQEEKRAEEEKTKEAKRQEKQKIRRSMGKGHTGGANAQKPAMAATSKVVSESPDVNAEPPRRGKAKVVCGCYGTRHKPLTNCLQCGRIACRHEGYGFCPFCGYDIEKVKVETAKDGKKFDKALLHKERLLRYDREFARRTVVLDDQADYFDRESAAWLTEEERAEAEGRDENRQREIHERKKPVLNIAF